MMQKIQQAQEKFESLEKRERLLIAGAVLAITFLLWDFGLTQPMKKEYVVLQARERVAKQESTAAEAEKTVLTKLNNKDPNEQAKKELEKIKLEVQALDLQLEELSAGLVKAEDLPLVLRDMLMAAGDIELLQLRTLPAQAVELGDAPEAAKAPMILEAENLVGEELPTDLSSGDAPALKIFKHQVKMVFSGDFTSVLRYLASLEQSNWQFYWQSLDYKVQNYPRARVTLRVFTLSADKGVNYE